MKKVFLILLLLSMCMLFSISNAEEPAVPSEPEVDISGNYKYIIQEDGTAKITKYSGKAENLVIPDK